MLEHVTRFLANTNILVAGHSVRFVSLSESYQRVLATAPMTYMVAINTHSYCISILADAQYTTVRVIVHTSSQGMEEATCRQSRNKCMRVH